MKNARLGFGLVSVALMIAACTAGTSTIGGDGGTGGGGGSGCPSAQPAFGTGCSPSGLSCSYGCATTATCNKGVWSVVSSNISCPQDGGIGPVDSGSPLQLPDGGRLCLSQNDCPSTLSCSPGGVSSGCGICVMPMNPCATDDDCKLIDDAAPSQAMVCGPGGPCTCAAGGKSGSCIPACKGANDCGADMACDVSGHCVSKPCTSDGDCAPLGGVDYSCGTTSVCAPKSCKSNAECSGGHYCVNGTCNAQIGICVEPVA
jgi:hypothetical protein